MHYNYEKLFLYKNGIIVQNSIFTLNNYIIFGLINIYPNFFLSLYTLVI